eukprot:9494157-Pyramimonas_sp.AAC.1
MNQGRTVTPLAPSEKNTRTCKVLSSLEETTLASFPVVVSLCIHRRPHQANGDGQRIGICIEKEIEREKEKL